MKQTTMVGTVSLALLALMVVPTSQASLESDVIDCREIDIDFVDTTTAVAFNACDFIAIAGGCTTTFAFAQTADSTAFANAQTADSLDLAFDQVGTTWTYYYNLYYNPVVPANVVSYTLAFTFGTYYNGLNYGGDTLSNSLLYGSASLGNGIAYVNCAV